MCCYQTSTNIHVIGIMIYQHTCIELFTEGVGMIQCLEWVSTSIGLFWFRILKWFKSDDIYFRNWWFSRVSNNVLMAKSWPHQTCGNVVGLANIAFLSAVCRWNVNFQAPMFVCGFVVQLIGLTADASNICNRSKTLKALHILNPFNTGFPSDALNTPNTVRRKIVFVQLCRSRCFQLLSRITSHTYLLGKAHSQCYPDCYCFAQRSWLQLHSKEPARS